MKKIEEKTMYVEFNFGNFGSFGHLTVTIYEGKTLEECIKLRSEDIIYYFDDETRTWKHI